MFLGWVLDVREISYIIALLCLTALSHLQLDSVLTVINAQVVKLVDAGDSKSPAARRAGSIPALGTRI